MAVSSKNGGQARTVMPSELVDEDGIINCIRIDGPDDTRGKARAFFASEWGEDFPSIRIAKHYYAPPEPECDECGNAPATCGVEATWKGDRHDGPTFSSPVCGDCQAAMLKREEGIYTRLTAVTAKTLKDVEPYDGWPVQSARRDDPGAVAYWFGEVA